jgi:hypothetical protein
MCSPLAIVARRWGWFGIVTIHRTTAQPHARSRREEHRGGDQQPGGTHWMHKTRLT